MTPQTATSTNGIDVPQITDITDWDEATALGFARAQRKFNTEAYQSRLIMARRLVEMGAVSFDDTGRIWVQSEQSQGSYLVNDKPCRCDDVRYNNAPGGYCKHRLASYIFALAHSLMEDGVEADHVEHEPMQTLPALVPANSPGQSDIVEPEYSRRSLAEIYDDLAKPPAQRHLSEKNTGKFVATYMHHATIRNYLDLYAPGWEWSTKIQGINGKLYVIGTLTIHGSDGSVSRDGIGNEDDEVTGYGDPSSNADAQALRRAAMAHGFCRNLWRK